MASPKESRSKYAVLGMLTLRAMSGYDLKKSFDTSVGFFWSESFGQIYPMLHALVEEGLASKESSANGGKDKVVYAITADGRRALRAWLAEPVAQQTPRVEILLKLFFARHASHGVARAHLEAFRTQLLATEAKYEGRAASLAPHRDRPDFPYWMMALHYGQHVDRGLLAWADESIAKISSLEKSAMKKPSGKDVKRAKGSSKSKAVRA